MNKSDLITLAWHKGALGFLLRPHQRIIYQRLHEVLATNDPQVNSYVLDIARQFGKSFTMFLVAVEMCLRVPGSTQVFIGPLKSQVKEIIEGNTFATIFQTCPPSLIPKLKDSALHFPNGSRIRLAGTDNKNYLNLRGGAAHNIFIDEAGFCSDLTSGVIPSVGPMTKTTRGKLIFASTPPEELDHDYYDVIREHEEQGLISTYTIWDDKHLDPQDLERIVNKSGGRDTTYFRREYECARIADTARQVVPELTNERLETLTNEQPDDDIRYHQKYVVVDWGGRDRTAAVFAHWARGRIVIQAGVELHGTKVTPRAIASALITTATKLWGSLDGVQWVCDNNAPLLMQDMIEEHGLPFYPVSKGRLVEMVQRVRDYVLDGQLHTTPDAIDVLHCCQAAVWSKNRDTFATSKRWGHYDLLAAVIYLVRVIDTSNKVPHVKDFNPHTQFYVPPPSNHPLNSIFRRPS